MLLLLGSVLLFVFDPAWMESPAFAASMLRIGCVLGAIWLAYPELSRLPRWLVPLLIGVAVAIAVKPKLALFLVPLVLAVLILRPKGKKPMASKTPPSKSATAGDRRK